VIKSLSIQVAQLRKASTQQERLCFSFTPIAKQFCPFGFCQQAPSIKMSDADLFNLCAIINTTEIWLTCPEFL
jgi:hypothetical protein